ncbi:MAG: ribonuclease PH [Rickettsiales bacterium]
MRPSGREPHALRPYSIDVNVIKNAGASCFVKCGDTHVICTASYENRTAPFLRNTGKGWLTAEYGMLPASTSERMRREASAGKQGGRTSEIQRLIGRSLRATLDFRLLGECQILIDCDVIQADGGTRTASVTGGYVALARLIRKLRDQRIVRADPLVASAAAVSCGIFRGEIVVDPDYAEDSVADADANFVFDGKGGVIEAQCTAEDKAFPMDKFITMAAMAKEATTHIAKIQAEAIAA